MNPVVPKSHYQEEEKEPFWVKGPNRCFSVRSKGGCDNPKGDFAYDRTRRIRAGACGAVYQATAREAFSPRVVKLDLSNTADVCSSEARFFRAMIGQPHVLQIRGGDMKNKSLAFDFIPSRDLEETMMMGLLPTEKTILCWKQALDALAACKRKSMVHRDVKPANGILEPSGHFTLIDGGLAVELARGSLRPAGDAVGTPAYMAPEFWFGLPYDHSVDLWSLGAVMFEMYVGEPLFSFKEDTRANFVFQQLQQTIGPIPPEFYARSEALQYAAACDKETIVFKDPVENINEAPWQDRIREAAVKRKDSEQLAERIIDILSEILKYKNRIPVEELVDSPLFSCIFDFRIESQTNLPNEHRLELGFRKWSSSYPLTRRINETCLHLFDQKKGVKGGEFQYRLISNQKGVEEVLEEGNLSLTPHATVKIDLKDSEKVKVE